MVFMPLDKVRPEVHQRNAPRGCKLFLDVLSFDRQSCGSVMSFLLGRTALVKSWKDFRACLDAGLDAVTLDGDQGERKGILKGGFYKHDQCLLVQLRNYEDTMSQVEETDKKVHQLNKDIAENNNLKNRLTTELEKVEAKMDRIKGSIDRAKFDHDMRVIR